MKKQEQNIYKKLIDQILPMLAVVVSIIGILGIGKDFSRLSENYLEILLAVLASTIGVVISFLYLRLLKQKRNGNIFISYSHKDKKFVEKLVQSLKVKRFNIFYDDEVINLGDNIKETIIANIKKCDLLILVLSQNNNVDSFTNFELKLALENNKKVIPILIDNDINIPDEISQIKYADFTKEYENNLRQLTKSLISNLEEKSSS